MIYAGSSYQSETPQSYGNMLLVYTSLSFFAIAIMSIAMVDWLMVMLICSCIFIVKHLQTSRLYSDVLLPAPVL